MSAIKVKIIQVRPLVAATFPQYKGRKIVVEPATEVCLYDLNWSGGSRNQYHACDLTGAPLGSMDRWNATAPWVWVNAAEGKSIPLPPGAVVVRSTIFSGTDCGLTIYVNPADMPKLLPAQVAA